MRTLRRVTIPLVAIMLAPSIAACGSGGNSPSGTAGSASTASAANGPSTGSGSGQAAICENTVKKLRSEIQLAENDPTQLPGVVSELIDDVYVAGLSLHNSTAGTDFLTFYGQLRKWQASPREYGTPTAATLLASVNSIEAACSELPTTAAG
jgi:hypothetical protein